MSVQNVSAQDKNSIIIGAWLLSSIALDFSTRYLLVDLEYDGLLLLNAWQVLILLIVSQAANLLLTVTGDGKPWHRIDATKVMELVMPVVVSLGSLPLLMHAIMAILPEWHQVFVVTSAPIVTALASRLLKHRPPKRKLLCIMAISGSLLLALMHGKHLLSWHDHLNQAGNIQPSRRVNVSPAYLFWIGFIASVLGVLSQASYSLLAERILHDPINLPVQTLVAYYAPFAFAMAVSGLFTEGKPDYATWRNLPAEALAANGLAACLKLYSTFALIKISSATTTALACMLQAGFTSLLASVVYNVPIGVAPALAFFFAFAGFAKYTEYEIEAGERPKDMSASEDGEELMSLSERNPPSAAIETERVSTNLIILLSGVIIAVLVIASMTKPEYHRVKPWDNSVKAYNDTRVATIIETRNLPHLIPLLLQFLSVLPDTWPMLVWGSRENIEVLKQSPAINRALQSGRLNITLFPDEFDIGSQEYLSRFLTKSWFWEVLPAEWILFFQSDSMLCSKSPDSIENWVGYSWVGAPWEDRPDAQGGNGGLSMRQRSALLQLTNDPDVQREDDGDPEDVWFSQNLGRLPDVKWPTRHQGRFSVENYWESMKEW
jgi:hypothetical protein